MRRPSRTSPSTARTSDARRPGEGLAETEEAALVVVVEHQAPRPGRRPGPGSGAPPASRRLPSPGRCAPPRGRATAAPSTAIGGRPVMASQSIIGPGRAPRLACIRRFSTARSSIRVQGLGDEVAGVGGQPQHRPVQVGVPFVVGQALVQQPGGVGDVHALHVGQQGRADSRSGSLAPPPLAVVRRRAGQLRQVRRGRNAAQGVDRQLGVRGVQGQAQPRGHLHAGDQVLRLAPRWGCRPGPPGACGRSGARSRSRASARRPGTAGRTSAGRAAPAARASARRASLSTAGS